MSVSVVIPLYNKARYVRRAVDSVLAQSQQAFEVVVVDDGSTDGGGGIVREVEDPRVRLVRQDHHGASAARNRGIEEASSELVAFLDADDEWLPCFLGTVLDLQARFPEAGMYATAYRHCRDGHAVRPHFTHSAPPAGGLLDDYFEAALGLPPVLACAVMIPRHVFRAVGVFPTDVSRGEDLWMWAKIALRYPVAWSPVEGAVYHLSPEGRASRATPAGDVAVAPLLEEFLQSFPVPSKGSASVSEYLGRWRLSDAFLLHLRGKTQAARELAAKTQGTRKFRAKRLRLRCALLVPPRALRRFDQL